MKTTVVYHSADFDGEFCREIARKFLPDAELIGWNFGDAPLPMRPDDGSLLYVMDLPIDRVFGCEFKNGGDLYSPDGKTYAPKGATSWDKVIWIDHHKSAIESHPHYIPGYRIDGVAACRLAWQWFKRNNELQQYYRDKRPGEPTVPVRPSATLPEKQDFIERNVSEPLAVRLAGEYDIWDKRDPRAELFQHGLRSRDLSNDWTMLLSLNSKMSVSEIEGLISVGHQGMLNPDGTVDNPVVLQLLDNGKVLQFARANEYRDVITQQGFTVQFEGLTFLACNSHELDIRSHLFEAGIKPEHDALLGFTYNGVSKDWRVSMYQIDDKKDVDILSIAKKYGGGGHQGANGFRTKNLTFLNQ